MWPVINLSALIGWNILSSLNAVISTNEKNWIHNSTHGQLKMFSGFSTHNHTAGQFDWNFVLLLTFQPITIPSCDAIG